MLLSLSSFIGFAIQRAYAQSPYFQVYCDALGTYCGDGQEFIIHIAVRTANALIIPLVGGIAVVAVIWAAIKMITSFGNDQGKEDAKKIIQFAVIGVALAVTGVAIVNWVCQLVQLGVNGSPDLCGF